MTGMTAIHHVATHQFSGKRTSHKSQRTIAENDRAFNCAPAGNPRHLVQLPVSHFLSIYDRTHSNPCPDTQADALPLFGVPN
jgi:hypothetical protein